MIKSLVNPDNVEVESDPEMIKNVIKSLGPNDMLIWCKLDEDGQFSYIVGDYKKIRAAVHTFDDALNCAKVFLGALTHYERVINRADKSFARLETVNKAMNGVFIDMANQKAKVEAKDRKDNPISSPVRNFRMPGERAMVDELRTVLKSRPIPTPRDAEAMVDELEKSLDPKAVEAKKKELQEQDALYKEFDKMLERFANRRSEQHY